MLLNLGETVAVLTPTVTGEDGLGEPIVTYGRSAVDNVVVAPGGTTGPTADRPQQATADLTLYFPKSFAGGLRGCLVEVRGETYRIVGDPQAYETTPHPWNVVAEAVREDG